MVQVGDQVSIPGWIVEVVANDEQVRIARWNGRNEVVYFAPVSWLREDGPLTLPTWSEVSDKATASIPLTDLEDFIYENEPAGQSEDEWRKSFAQVLAAISGRLVVFDVPEFEKQRTGCAIDAALPVVTQIQSQEPEFMWTLRDQAGQVGAAIDAMHNMHIAEGALPSVVMQATDGHRINLDHFLGAARGMIAALDQDSTEWRVHYDAMKAMLEGKYDGGQTSSSS